MDPRRSNRARFRGGFTLVELLVVIAIIIVLLSLLVVGLNLATKAAQSANSSALMLSLKQSLVRFRDDVGYYPPILSVSDNPDENRALDPGPGLGGGGMGGQGGGNIQDWFSYTSLAEYLIGWDSGRYDGHGNVDLGEVPFTGIRHPGPDGVWGASQWDGLLARRNPVSTGTVFGPYLELESNRLLASTDGTFANGQLRVFMPGEAGFDPDGTKVIVDYWGNPIQYFRRVYPPGGITQSYRAGVDYDGDGDVDANDLPPTLADVFRLRPYPNTVAESALTDGNLADGRGDTGATYELRAAEFALFSPGANRAYNRDMLFDDDELNRDNLVEVGP